MPNFSPAAIRTIALVGHGASGGESGWFFEVEEVIDRLAAANQSRLTLRDEDGGRTRHRVVVR